MRKSNENHCLEFHITRDSKSHLWNVLYKLPVHLVPSHHASELKHTHISSPFSQVPSLLSSHWLGFTQVSSNLAGVTAI